MLVVKTELRISPVHGLGLFAAEPIVKSRAVVRYHPAFDLIVPEKDLVELPAAFREAIDYYGYFDEESRVWMYNADNGRFINHADEPNLKMGRRIMLAARDIAVGEEITADYRGFCDACRRDLQSVFANTRPFVDFASVARNTR